MRLHAFVLMSLGLVAAPWAAASTFSVSPIRIQIGPSAPTEALTLHNSNDTSVVVQVQAVEWTQAGSSDEFAPTRDIVATPQVLTIPPDSDAIVRVALRRSAHPTRELSYRIFIQEVPPADVASSGELNVALRLSLPVFVAPAGASAAAHLEWAARWVGENSLQMRVSNRGEAHVQLFEVGVALDSAQPERPASVGRYVLPGSDASWVMRVGRPATRDNSIRVRASSDVGEWEADIVPR